MFVDALIPRLRDAGLTVHDIRGQLPRNGRWMGRAINQIKRIAVHYDAEHRPDSYDSVQRYKNQAQYHINKDWGGGARGDGLMYALVVDNVGEVFMCRDFEDVTWHVGDPNYTAVGTKYDCGGDQEPTREQMETMKKVLDVLTTKCPEFPASRGDVYGHLEFKQFGGTATACPGKILPFVKEYRSSGNVSAGNLKPAKTSNPQPSPQPGDKPKEPTMYRSFQTGRDYFSDVYRQMHNLLEGPMTDANLNHALGVLGDRDASDNIVDIVLGQLQDQRGHTAEKLKQKEGEIKKLESSKNEEIKNLEIMVEKLNAQITELEKENSTATPDAIPTGELIGELWRRLLKLK